MRAHVERTISALRGEGPEAAATEEPLVTVVAEVDCFDVGLRADLAEQHPALVEWLIAELADRDGVVSVQRYGTSALVVDVPSWDELRLRMWLTLWLQRRLPRRAIRPPRHPSARSRALTNSVRRPRCPTAGAPGPPARR